MKKIIPVLFLIIMAFSCNEKNKKDSLTFDNLKVEKQIFALNDSTLPYMKMLLDFTYPVTFCNDSILLKIQKIFVGAFAGEEYTGRSPKGAFEAYEKFLTDESLEMASELGDDLQDFSEYFQSVKTSVVDSVNNVLTIKTESENYMGGAHGAHTVYYFNIDLHDASEITEDSVFKDDSFAQLSEYLTEALHEKYGERINDILFETENIQPNGNFYFNSNGITYIYNEYEIAPYSVGMIEVVIPWDKANTILRERYKNE